MDFGWVLGPKILEKIVLDLEIWHLRNGVCVCVCVCVCF